jgi:hypothetical protein
MLPAFKKLNPSDVTAAVISITIGTLISSFAVPSAPGGAWHFPALANWIAGQNLSSVQPLEVRDLGYPLFLWLINSNYIVFFQSAMACAIPFMIYLAVKSFSKVAGWISMILTILSLAPFQFVGWLHHDQLFIFLITLSTLFTIKFLTNSSRLMLGVATLSWILTSISRPAAGLAGIAIFIFFALTLKGSRKIIIISLLIMIVTIGGYSTLRSSKITAMGGTDYSKLQLFFTGYVVNGDGKNGARITSLDDIDSKNLRRLITSATKRISLDPEKELNWLHSQGYSDLEIPSVFPFLSLPPSAKATFLMDNPSQDNFEYIQFLIDGQANLLGRVGLKLILSNPANFMSISISNLRQYVFDPGWVYPRHISPSGPQKVKGAWQVIFLGRNTADAQLVAMPRNVQSQFENQSSARSQQLYEKLNSTILYRGVNYNKIELYGKFFNFLGAFFGWTILFALILIFSKNRRDLSYIITAISIPFVVIAIVTSATAGPDYRYVNMTFPFLAILFGLSATKVYKELGYLLSYRNSTNSNFYTRGSS